MALVPNGNVKQASHEAQVMARCELMQAGVGVFRQDFQTVIL